MVGFGLEYQDDEEPKPLCIGDEWIVFANYSGAKMAAMLLSALTCYDFKIVDLQERLEKGE